MMRLAVAVAFRDWVFDSVGDYLEVLVCVVHSGVKQKERASSEPLLSESALLVCMLKISVDGSGINFNYTIYDA